jgi:hypothetical protein
MDTTAPGPATEERQTHTGLPEIPVPEALWRSARDRIRDQPRSWPVDAADGHWLSDWLWAQWAVPLAACGVTPELLAATVVGYRQELWLWLMGQRTWQHIVSSLAGLVLRRAPASNLTR